MPKTLPTGTFTFSALTRSTSASTMGYPGRKEVFRPVRPDWVLPSLTISSVIWPILAKSNPAPLSWSIIWKPPETPSPWMAGGTTANTIASCDGRKAAARLAEDHRLRVAGLAARSRSPRR